MTNILDVYRSFKILPFLQLHQLRVAAVARQICDACTAPVDTDGVLAATLLHDMGNILKFDMSSFPESYEPEGVAYWRHIKGEYRAKYGANEHDATLAIANEIGISEQIKSYMRAVGFSNVPATRVDPVLEKKICCYADQRVAPFGVVSIQQRIEDGAKRYANRLSKLKDTERQNRSVEGLHAIERQIFEHTTIRPDEITDASIAAAVEQLKNYSI